MSHRNPLTAVVRLSQSDQLGPTMMRLRIWLDSHKIELREFKTAANGKSYTFTITFRSRRDANHFRAKFGTQPTQTDGPLAPGPMVPPITYSPSTLGQAREA